MQNTYGTITKGRDSPETCYLLTLVMHSLYGLPESGIRSILDALRLLLIADRIMIVVAEMILRSTFAKRSHVDLGSDQLAELLETSGTLSESPTTGLA